MKMMSRKERDKKRREQDIVAAAEKIFIASGYEGASMDAIATAAEFTKRTVYQYFRNKDDLFFAVVLKSYELLQRYILDAAGRGRNGLERLKGGYLGFYRFYEEHPGRLALITAVGRVKAEAKESPYLEKFNSFDMQLFESIREGLGEGQADGSIDSSLDVKMESCTLTFMMTAFFHLLSFTGRSYIEFCGLDESEFVERCIDAVTDHLKAPAGGAL